MVNVESIVPQEGVSLSKLKQAAGIARELAVCAGKTIWTKTEQWEGRKEVASQI